MLCHISPPPDCMSCPGKDPDPKATHPWVEHQSLKRLQGLQHCPIQIKQLIKTYQTLTLWNLGLKIQKLVEHKAVEAERHRQCSVQIPLSCVGSPAHSQNNLLTTESWVYCLPVEFTSWEIIPPPRSHSSISKSKWQSQDIDWNFEVWVKMGPFNEWEGFIQMEWSLRYNNLGWLHRLGEDFEGKGSKSLGYKLIWGAFYCRVDGPFRKFLKWTIKVFATFIFLGKSLLEYSKVMLMQTVSGVNGFGSHHKAEEANKWTKAWSRETLHRSGTESESHRCLDFRRPPLLQKVRYVSFPRPRLPCLQTLRVIVLSHP